MGFLQTKESHKRFLCVRSVIIYKWSEIDFNIKEKSQVIFPVKYV